MYAGAGHVCVLDVCGCWAYMRAWFLAFVVQVQMVAIVVCSCELWWWWWW